jgi:hypothetical protein
MGVILTHLVSVLVLFEKVQVMKVIEFVHTINENILFRQAKVIVSDRNNTITHTNKEIFKALHYIFCQA